MSKTDEKWTWVSACKVFGVSPDASWEEEIKSAHARMMHEWHPDHGDTLERTEKTKTLNLAWDFLCMNRCNHPSANVEHSAQQNSTASKTQTTTAATAETGHKDSDTGFEKPDEHTTQKNHAAGYDSAVILRPDVSGEDLYVLFVQEPPEGRGFPGLALKFVPIEYRTRKVCSTAVSEATRALQFVPDGLLDEDMYRSTFQYQHGNTHFISYFWDLLSIPKIREVALRVDPEGVNAAKQKMYLDG